MHDAHALLGRHPGRQQIVDLQDAWDVAGRGVHELGAPALQLAFDVAPVAPEVGEPHGVEVHVVKAGQNLDQRLAHPPTDPDRYAFGNGHVADHETGHEVHDVERGAVHVVVLAEPDYCRNRHTAVSQSTDDPVFPGHVVGGRQDVAHRRPAQHPATTMLVGHREREVGASAGYELELQPTVDASDPPVEPPDETVVVDSRCLIH